MEVAYNKICKLSEEKKMSKSDKEIWDLYSENRTLLGKDHVRGGQLPADGYHLVVHVWIYCRKTDRCFLQKRAK